MKRITCICLFIIIFTGLSFGQNVKLMTYNIRYDNPKDGKNAWPNRKEILLNQILFYEPDIFGTQEGLEHQINFLDKNLISFQYVGVGRSDVKENGSGEFSAIFYNAKKYVNLRSGTFWLSETPNKPSRGWDANLNRICTYILLKENETGLKFWVFNTHFDHRGILARKNSAELILQKIQTINDKNLPLFLIGDFNLLPEEAPIQLLAKQLNDSKLISKNPPFGPVGTSNGFDVCKTLERRIDYIFSSKKNITIKKYGALANVNDIKFPSDHLPVYVEAEIRK